MSVKQTDGFIMEMGVRVEGLPELDDSIKCPNHPNAHVSTGFGLAGGGYGTYTLCDECCRVLSKTMDDEDWE